MDATRDPVKKVESIQYTMLGKARMASSNSGDCWYFAYGSNLDPDQKEARTGRIREARKARVVGYQLAFNKLGRDGTGKANIVPDKTSEVWGVVYRCDPAGLQRMDHSEGVAGGHYKRTRIFVQAESDEKLEAISYIAETDFIRSSLLPSGEYLERIVRGARHHQLPEDYIRQVEAFGRGKEH
jgi:gamma-glutamylcyclotransferase (GGCT)/AIG2-like uncharacterized protein YtfP